MMKGILFVLVSLFFSIYCHAQEQTLNYTSKIGKIKTIRMRFHIEQNKANA